MMPRSPRTAKKQSKQESHRLMRHVPIMVLLAAALLLGFVVLPHYGESWDEADVRSQASGALNSYRYLMHPSRMPESETILNMYGPAFATAAALLSRLFQFLRPGWSALSTWHATYFLTFLGGILCLYLLALRWLSHEAAFGVAALFLAQPMLWGHSFINPRDIPMMSFFVASIYAGFRMSDQLVAPPWIGLRVLPAAILVGLASAIRAAGPLAAAIVLVHVVFRLRSKSFLLVTAYLLIAVTTIYLGWPFLWNSPLVRFLDSVRLMSNHPWDDPVLFAGRVYQGSQLPAGFFPTFVAIQLTEPALILLLAGLVLDLRVLRRGLVSPPLMLFVAWFLVPGLLLADWHVLRHDNARHFMFLLPPLFILAGVAMDKVFSLLTRPFDKILVVMLAILPGVVSGIQLHPYEYVYYNAVVGGTAGAHGRYEMDYWGTSFADTAEWLNAAADDGATVVVFGPRHLISSRLAKNSKVLAPSPDSRGPGYAVVLIRAQYNEETCANAPIVHAVSRVGVTLALVRAIPDGESCR